MAKESKTCQLKTTITPTLKKVLDEYCDVKKTTVAEFTRDCLTEKLLEYQKEKESRGQKKYFER